MHALAIPDQRELRQRVQYIQKASERPSQLASASEATRALTQLVVDVWPKLAHLEQDRPADADAVEQVRVLFRAAAYELVDVKQPPLWRRLRTSASMFLLTVRIGPHGVRAQMAELQHALSELRETLLGLIEESNPAYQAEATAALDEAMQDQPSTMSADQFGEWLRGLPRPTR
jgi:hypothetical protein